MDSVRGLRLNGVELSHALKQTAEPPGERGARSTQARDRVNEAIGHQRPDRTPRDFVAVPEVWRRLEEHFGTRKREEVLVRLGVDCRIVSYDSFCHDPRVDPAEVDWSASLERSSLGGMWRRVLPDGSTRDIWGAHRQKVANGFGVLEQFASHPLAQAQSLEELKAYPWPEPGWWDFRALPTAIAALNDQAVYHTRYRAGSVFETAWSLVGFERFLSDLAVQPELPAYVMERVAEVHLANLETVLRRAGTQIDLVYFYDDLASQNGLLIGASMYDRFIRPHHQAMIDLAARFGKPTMLHCCGSVYPLVPRLIEMGVAVLNPVQPRAKNMDGERLARDFGGRIAFHGGIDIQDLLPRATLEQVREQVASTCEVLGAQGGYIMCGSHHIQADTPIENILAMYGAD
jgi:uroporphyrinogen decarboxylase